MSDAVNHPPHYIGTNGIEVIDVIEGFGLGHHLGAALAYILRADRKGAAIEDLKKAAFYIAREVANRERDAVVPTPFREMRGVLNIEAGKRQAEAHIARAQRKRKRGRRK